jgi:MFS family permease
MKVEGFSTASIGIVGLGYGVGFIAGCIALAAIVQGFGYVRAFVVLASCGAVATLALTTSDSISVWTVLRAVNGVSLAGLLILVDTWIGSSAASESRGRSLAVCYLANRAALMSSPLAVTFTNSVSDGLFVLTAAAIFLALVPIILANDEVPRTPKFKLRNIGEIFVLSPSAAVASMTTGIMFGSVVSLSPVYGLDVELSPAASAALIFVMQGGALLVQWPAGSLSDRVDRRWIILALICGISVASVGILVSASQGWRWGIFLFFAICGGSTFCVYPLCIAHGCDLVARDKILQAVSSLLLCWAVGLTIGPVPSSILMEIFGPSGLLYFSASTALLVAIFLLWRIRSYPRFIRDKSLTDGSASVSDLKS